jgi:predicted metal-binding membrane protein
MTPVQLTRRHPEILAGVLLVAGLAWWWTVERMAGMGAAPGTALGTLGWFTGSWVVMMAAMMLPSLAPTLAAYTARARGRESMGWLWFAAGYLLVWTAAGVVAYGVFELGKSLIAGDLAWHQAGRWVSGGVLAAAAAYQFTPAKRACLTRCRGQLSERSDRGALLMGVRSGGWCLGCSWALMAALFALGVMSITWMVVIAALVALEKTGPWRSTARLATATVLALLALGIFVAPGHVPGFVLPGSPSAMRGTMSGMG